MKRRRFRHARGPMTVVGLTGGIAMGKSTAAAAFRRARFPVFDADAEVRRLQAPDGAALRAIADAFPGTIALVNGRQTLDRGALRTAVLGNPCALAVLEGILHPMVRNAERRFLARAQRAGSRAAVLDIPLLFETGSERRVDRVLVVSAPRSAQLTRVRQRRRLSESQIAAMLARQMADGERRRRGDLVVRTGLSRRHALRQLASIIAELRG